MYEKRMIKKSIKWVLTALLIMTVFMLSSCVRETSEKKFESLDDFNGCTIGVDNESAYIPLLEERYPDSDIIPYNDYSDIIYACGTGKIDAFVAGFKQFCAKQGFERKEINAALATCDEIINGIIAPTLNEASHVLMQAEHSESTGETTYSISCSGDRLDPHDTDDFLRLKLIEHYTGGFLYEFIEDEEMHNRVTVVKRSIKQA